MVNDPNSNNKLAYCGCKIIMYSSLTFLKLNDPKSNDMFMLSFNVLQDEYFIHYKTKKNVFIFWLNDPNSSYMFWLSL